MHEQETPYVVTDLTNNQELLEEVKGVFDHNTTPIVVRVDQGNERLDLIGGFSELDNFFSVLPEEEAEEEEEETSLENDEEEEAPTEAQEE